MGDQADMTAAPPHDDLCADVAACLGLPVVAMTVAPAGGAGHVAYEVYDPARPGAPVAFYRCESGFGWRYRPAPGGRDPAHRGRPRMAGAARARDSGEPARAAHEPDSGHQPARSGRDRSRPRPSTSRWWPPSTPPNRLSFPIEQYATMGEAVSDDLGWWTAYAGERGSLEEPLVRLAARVLAATLPATDERPSLVHGDVGAGNFMVDGGRVSAMIDWELAHVGDPHEDMAWLWMRGRPHLLRRSAATARRVRGRCRPVTRSRPPPLAPGVRHVEELRGHVRGPAPASDARRARAVDGHPHLRRPPRVTAPAAPRRFAPAPRPGSRYVRVTPATQPADRMLESTELSKESRLVLTLPPDRLRPERVGAGRLRGGPPRRSACPAAPSCWPTLDSVADDDLLTWRPCWPAPLIGPQWRCRTPCGESSGLSESASERPTNQ